MVYHFLVIESICGDKHASDCEYDCPNRKALFKHIFETISNVEHLESITILSERED